MFLTTLASLVMLFPQPTSFARLFLSTVQISLPVRPFSQLLLNPRLDLATLL